MQRRAQQPLAILSAIAILALASGPGCGSGEPDGVLGIQFGLVVPAAPGIPDDDNGIPIIEAADLVTAGGLVDVDPQAGMVRVQVFGLPPLPPASGAEYLAVLLLGEPKMGSDELVDGSEEEEVEVGHLMLDVVGRGVVMNSPDPAVDLERAVGARIEIVLESEAGANVGNGEAVHYAVLEGEIGTPLPGTTPPAGDGDGDGGHG